MLDSNTKRRCSAAYVPYAGCLKMKMLSVMWQDIDTTVRSWEVFKVMEVDLGLHLSEDDKQVRVNPFMAYPCARSTKQ